MKTLKFICRTALPLIICAPGAALAQSQAAPSAPAEGTRSQTESAPSQPVSASAQPQPRGAEAEPQVNFSSDQLSYDSDADVVTASGNVHMTREGNNLRADTVIWNRKTGEVRAEGGVRVIDPQGDIAYGDSVQLTDTLKDGVVENLLLVLADGGRLAADRATRTNGYTTLYNAAYSPCAVTDDKGCPKNPTWEITAVRVFHDPVKHRISYKGATLRLFGAPILALPGLSHPDGSGGGGSGVLVPDIRFSRNNGAELALPWYWRIGPNRDLTITPHVYTEVYPLLEGQYRALTSLGAYQLHGFITYGSRLPVAADPGVVDKDEGIRGYVEANGTFQLNPLWSITASGRYVTDRTFLRRYDISLEDRLRSVVNAERISDNSYISIAGWAFQSLRSTDVGIPQPIALPAIDARWRLADPIWDGHIEVQANSLAILRNEGQDSQRAFASVRWDRRSITPLGQELTLTAFARGDVYHANQGGLNDPALYQGEPGWHGRLIAALAADLRWPFVGSFLGGTQMIAPRVQIVASPKTKNLEIPNEDARSVDLEDSNLFAVNRFPGYDRWEDGARITYGVDWNIDLPRVAVAANIGQSYRLNRKPSLFPEGTGLSDRFSDYVGRVNFKFSRFFSVVERFRLDKDNLAVRSNEVDAVVGGRKTYAQVGYLRLNRDMATGVEDFPDREELRLGGRLQLTRFWSVFGSTVIDLTDKEEDPLSNADGYEPVRHRLGVTYEDDCLEVGFTWRHDYETTGDFKSGSTFLLRVALKNLGR